MTTDKISRLFLSADGHLKPAAMSYSELVAELQAATGGRPIPGSPTGQDCAALRPLTSDRRASTARKPGQNGHKSPEAGKLQVRIGAPPGTRTPNPRIKSPLLNSIYLDELYR